MNRLPDLSTAIHFLKSGGGEPGGNVVSAASAQTGDFIGIILAIIAAISIIAIFAITVYAKNRSTQTSANGTVAATKKVGIALSIVALISLLGMLYCYTPLGKAFAQDTLASKDVVYAYVDENTGKVTFDENYLVNDGAQDLYVSKSEVCMTQDVAAIEGIDQLTLKIAGDNNVLYEGNLAKPGSPYPYTPEYSVFRVGEKSPLYYSLDNCSKETALALIDKTVMTTSLYTDTFSGFDLDPNREDKASESNNEITINYNCDTGGIVSTTSESLATDTSTPKGTKAYAGKQFVFHHWNNAAGQEVSRTNPFVPEPGEDGKYVSTTYTAIFRYVEEVEPLCYNIDFESLNLNQGSVSSSYYLAIKNPTYTYNVIGNSVEILSSTGARSNTIWATPNAGYEFSHWKVIDASGKETDPKVGATTIASNLKFIAYFKGGEGQDVYLTFNKYVDSTYGDYGQANKTDLSVPYGTHYKWVETGKSRGNVYFYNEQGEVIDSVLFDAKPGFIDDGYMVDTWFYFDVFGHRAIPFDVEGEVYEDTDCFYRFVEQEATITYQISDLSLPQGDVALNDEDQPGTSVSETISRLDQNYEGAYASEWEEIDYSAGHNFVSTFSGWTVEGHDVGYSRKYISPEAIEKIANDIWEEEGWCDLTLVAHFVSAKAIYDPLNYKMTFYYDESGHPEVTANNYKFGVNNTHFDMEYTETGSIANFVFPTWCYSDGTPKVYPTSVVFDKSFKAYEDLTSMSFWFLSGAYRNTEVIEEIANDQTSLFDNAVEAIMSKINLSPRYITSIEGLENVYTKNLKETAFMFASNPNVDSPLTKLDFSTWDTPMLENTIGMFENNAYLNDLRFPATGAENRFGENIKYMDYMFAGLRTIPSIHLTNNFGAIAKSMYRSFGYCTALTYLEVDNLSGLFGSQAEEMQEMFLECTNLRSINIANSKDSIGFGSSCLSARGMFAMCYNLRKVDLSHFKTEPYYNEDNSENVRRGYESILFECYNLTEIKLSNKWTIPFAKISNLPSAMIGDSVWYCTFDITEKIIPQDRPISLIEYERAVERLIKEGTPYVATLRMNSAKGLYVGNTLTFVYDHIDHPDVERVFTVNNTGLRGLNSDYYYPGVLLKNASRSSDYNVSLNSRVIGMHHEPIPAYRQQATIYNIFPEWYNVTVTANGEVSIKCTVDAHTVVFDKSFREFYGLYSMDFWFCADSDGYQPFTNFSGLWENVYTDNLDSLCCTFGGISYDAIISNAYWSESESGPIENGILASEDASAFDVLSDQLYGLNGKAELALSDSAYLAEFLNGIYFHDSYGTSVRSITFTANDDWDAALHLASENIISVTRSWPRIFIRNWAGAFANATELQSVTFPDGIEETGPGGETYLHASARIDCGDAMFYNCSKLTQIVNMDDFDTTTMRECRYMFYGCNSLKSLDLTNWNTRGISFNMQRYSPTDYDYVTYSQLMFAGCDSLRSLKIGEDWILPLNICSLSDKWSDFDSTTEKYAWTYTETSSHVHSYDMPGLDFTTYWQTYEPDDIQVVNPGEYTRDARYLDKFNLSFVSENTEYGTVSPSGKNVASYTGVIPYYNTDDSGLKVGTNHVVPTAKEGYEFKFWTVEFDDGTTEVVKDFDCYTAFYSELAFRGVPYAFNNYNEKLVVDRLIEIDYPSQFRYLEELQYMRETSATFTAHFAPADYTAKAVYVQNMQINDHTENALIMYYDNLDHSSEGTVYSISDESGYVSKYNTKVKLPDDARWSGGIYNQFISVAPSWYDSKYEFYTSYARKLPSLKPVLEAEVVKASAIDSLSGESLEIGTFQPAYQHYASVNYRYQYECLVDASSVIFDSSFADYDSLKSISMWFMADSNGYQPFKNFYSRDVNGNLSEGFANLNTTSLQHAEYAFGGYIDGSYMLNNEAAYFDRETAVGKLSTKTAFDVLYEKLFGYNNWGGAYQSYGNSIENLDLSTLDLTHTKNWSYMLANAVGLRSVTFPANVNKMYPTNIEGLFYNCESLGLDSQTGFVNPAIVNLDKFNTSKVYNMDYLFYGCSHLVSLDLSSFNTENVRRGVLVEKGNKLAVDSSEVAEAMAENERISRFHEQEYNGNYAAYGVFTQCYRLAEFKISSTYDKTKESKISGWDLNMCGCGLEDFENYTWTNTKEGRTFKDDLYSLDIPINPDDTYSSRTVLTGVFSRENAGQEVVIFASQENEAGEPMGMLNGQEQIEYGFLNNATIQVDSTEPDVLWVDNVRIKAEANPGYRFKYWMTDEGFYWHEQEQAGWSIPFDKEFTIDFGMSGLSDVHTYPIIAVYAPETETAKALFYANNNGEGIFDFVYDDNVYVINSRYGNTDYKLAAVYPVDASTNDYDLPSWYKEKSDTYIQGDGHKIPTFDSVIAKKIWKNNAIEVVFEESFSNYDELTSLSCWFMPAVTSTEGLLDAFDKGSIDGWDNVVTNRIVNVNYMFGGHEYFNDYCGSKSDVINLDGFDATPLTNFDGMFANCIDLDTIIFDDSFVEAQPTSMRKTFFNCRLLIGTDLKKVLTNFDTSQVTDMSYMFGMYSLTDPDEKDIYEKLVYSFPENWNMEQVRTLEGFFSGRNDTACIKVENMNTYNEDLEYSLLTSTSGMYRGCTWLDHIEFTSLKFEDNIAPIGFNTSQVTNMSYMFADCKHITSVAQSYDGSKPGFVVISSPSWTQNMSLWDALNFSFVSNYSYMFYGCENLEDAYVDLSNSKIVYEMGVPNAIYMFANCPNLNYVAFNYFRLNYNTPVYLNNTTSVPSYYNMFVVENDYGATLPNDHINDVWLSSSWNDNISLADCGVASVDNTTGDYVLWLRENGSSTYEFTNYLTTELGLYTGYFSKATHNIKFSVDTSKMSASQISRYDWNIAVKYNVSDWDPNYFSSVDVNQLGWNSEHFDASVMFGPAKSANIGYGSFALQANQALVKCTPKFGEEKSTIYYIVTIEDYPSYSSSYFLNVYTDWNINGERLADVSQFKTGTYYDLNKIEDEDGTLISRFDMTASLHKDSNYLSFNSSYIDSTTIAYWDYSKNVFQPNTTSYDSYLSPWDEDSYDVYYCVAGPSVNIPDIRTLEEGNWNTSGMSYPTSSEFIKQMSVEPGSIIVAYLPKNADYYSSISYADKHKPRTILRVVKPNSPATDYNWVLQYGQYMEESQTITSKDTWKHIEGYYDPTTKTTYREFMFRLQTIIQLDNVEANRANVAVAELANEIDDLAAADVDYLDKTTAFQQLAELDTPVAEYAAAALSIVSFPIPLTFFNLIADIVVF